LSAARSNSLRTPSFLLGAVIVLCCAFGLSQAGEKPRFYSSGKWQDGQKSAVASKLVVVAKVIKAGKAGGKGWDGNTQREGNYQQWTGEVKIDQQVTVEITEVLRGSFAGKKLKVTLGSARFNYQELSKYWRSNYYKRGKRVVAPQLPAGVFALHQGRAYVLFLNLPKPGGKDKDGKELPASTTHLERSAAAETGNASLLKSVKGFCKQLHAWEHPPKLSGAEAGKVKKLIEQLGDEQYEKRQAADKALRGIAHRLEPQLTKAAKGRDLERATAAEKILNDFRPRAGKTMYPKPPAGSAKPQKPAPAPAPAPAPKPVKGASVPGK
jgi:hypothetical protein